MISRHAWMLAVLATLSLLVSARLWTDSDDPNVPLRTAAIPARWGTWQGTDLAMTDRQYDLLESRDVLLREYEETPSTARVLACVAVAGGSRKAAHPPEVCYRGQGFEILSQEVVSFRHGEREWPAQRLRVSKGGDDLLVLTWYRVGRTATASYLRQQWLGMRAELRAPDEVSALVRLSVLLDGDESRAEQQIARFCAGFLPLLEQTVFEPSGQGSR